MATSFTCHHRHLAPGGYDHCSSGLANNHKNSPSLHIASTLASTPLPGSALSSWAVTTSISSSLDTTPPKAISPTVITANLSNTSLSIEDEMSPSQSLRAPKRKRTVSPPQSLSARTFDEVQQQLRSTSRSSRRSVPHSRHSSIHSHYRTATNASLTPSSAPDSPNRRENLLALHRESCRLFQDHEIGGVPLPARRQSSSPPSSPHTPPRALRTSSNISSPPVSPILEAQPSVSIECRRDSSSKEAFYTTRHVATTPLTFHPAPTVIDWTSPSTRRREYEEIDRATSGVRGFWRRVAPRWCQFGHARVPFFEEKDGKGNYEGSVRRFRIDLPEEPVADGSPRRGLNLKQKLTVRRKMH
ncbi:hypothetical protein ARAM_007795 [Aspergillus rambellii]|uniref:Uncharacterized protein n=1 Tax=Aspergillus rambellii TaxID=308745 RepID=A0A0F8U8G1_9EURO|nr:hypothetical protein ARAM_007795 [Aspergillus rambellii]